MAFSEYMNFKFRKFEILLATLICRIVASPCISRIFALVFDASFFPYRLFPILSTIYSKKKICHSICTLNCKRNYFTYKMCSSRSKDKIDIHLPNCWVDLSSNSFFLFEFQKSWWSSLVDVHPWVSWNSSQLST